MAGYTRQSTYTDGDVIQAADSNNEFDQLLDAFNNSTGHAHDGTSAEGPVIGLIGDAGVTTPLNKIAVDTGNKRLSFYIDVTSAATEQLRVEDGIVYPVTTNDIDLGTTVYLFKDGFFAGTLESVSLETTNIKANDGTASATIADTTGIFTIASAVLTTADINGGTVDNTVIGATTPLAGNFTTLGATGNITVGGTVDGRDVAADGTKLDGIEALADVTDTDNVTAAGALMDSELTNITAVKALDQGVATTDSPTFVTINATTVNATTFDMTNIEVTNIKAKDGTAAGSIADITGVVTLASSVLTTADINGGTIDGTTIGGTTPAAITGTAITGTSFATSGNMTFGDNDKAIFGAGSDLQIYHDGTNSRIKDAGSGSLTVNATDFYVTNSADTQNLIRAIDGSQVDLYHNGSVKLATTSTGIDVTGSLDVTDATTTRTNLDVDQAGTALALAIALG